MLGAGTVEGLGRRRGAAGTTAYASAANTMLPAGHVRCATRCRPFSLLQRNSTGTAVSEKNSSIPGRGFSPQMSFSAIVLWFLAFAGRRDDCCGKSAVSEDIAGVHGCWTTRSPAIWLSLALPLRAFTNPGCAGAVPGTVVLWVGGGTADLMHCGLWLA